MLRFSVALVLGSMAACSGGTSDRAPIQASKGQVLTSIDRRIAREPAYLAKPLYGLIIFDPEGKSKVWFVLDRSSPTETDHDLLYIDRNGNGDLTDPDERFAGVRGRGNWITHQPGSIKIGHTGPEHTEVTIFSSSAQMGGSGPYFRFKLGGKTEMWGGFAKPGEEAGLGPSPEKAPVFRASLDAPLTFIPALLKSEYPQGGSERIAVIVGLAGIGPASFTGVHETYLVPGKDRLFGTWIGKTIEGRPIRERFEIRDHC